jgi:hypothetical protein
MGDKTKRDEFFDFLLDRLENEKEKIILEMLKKYPGRSKSETRKIIREVIEKFKTNNLQ